MASSTVRRVYAEGLYRAAKVDGAEEAVGREIRALAEVFGHGTKAWAFLSTPAIPKGTKHEALKGALSGKVSPSTLHFLFLLVDKRRQGHLAEIAEEYQLLLDEGAGLLRGEVSAARPLADDGRKRLETALSARFSRPVLLRERVDPRMIGGARVQVGDFVIDGGFDHRLRRMRRQLLEKEVMG